jgi:hypothetical protein
VHKKGVSKCLPGNQPNIFKARYSEVRACGVMVHQLEIFDSVVGLLGSGLVDKLPKYGHGSRLEGFELPSVAVPPPGDRF